MSKFKNSEKKGATTDIKIRREWDISPRTRVKKSQKLYKRSKRKQEDRRLLNDV